MRSRIYVGLVVAMMTINGYCATAAAQVVQVERGEDIRVWPRVAGSLDPDVRLLAPKSKYVVGKLLYFNTDTVVFETTSPVATVWFVPIGHWDSEFRVPISEIERLQVYRLAPFRKPRRKDVLIGAGIGLAAATLFAHAGWQCNEQPCSAAFRYGLGAGVGAVTSVVMIFGRTSRWEDIPLHN